MSKLPELLGPAEFAEAAGLARTTIDQYRWNGKLPEPVIVSGHPVWHREQVEEWLATRNK